MKRLFLWGGLAVCAFIIWQWWLSRRNPDVQRQDQERQEADNIGRGRENVGMVARPRLMSDERFGFLAGFLDPQTSGGSEQPTKSPMIFGFN